MSDSKRLALVTGASRGIGRATAETLAKSGFTVVGTATSEAGAQNIQSFLGDLGGEHLGVTLNVSEKESVNEALANIKTHFGKMPDVLVNNAGITRDNLFLRMKDEEWDDLLATNLRGIFYLCKACVKSMIKSRWGRIISVGSVVGSTGNAGQTNYAAAKAGVIGFSKSLAQEIGARGVTVNVVSPGFIDTDMTKSLPEETKAQLLNSIPLNRLGEPQEIANAIDFLASEQASYITGTTLHVNGGMFMN